MIMAKFSSIIYWAKLRKKLKDIKKDKTVLERLNLMV